jgi:glutathione S-transferase
MPLMSKLPVLYTFRRCPYAIRARMAIMLSGVMVNQQEIDLKNKPEHMLKISPKATVPVLELGDGSVIDESLDIMLWALRQHDPLEILDSRGEISDQAHALIDRNDNEFKHALDHYKYPERYPESSASYYRGQGEIFLHALNSLLNQNSCLLNDKASIADLALMPFVRQFSQVDKAWFENSPYPKLKNWLNAWIASDVFITVMKK